MTHVVVTEPDTATDDPGDIAESVADAAVSVAEAVSEGVADAAEAIADAVAAAVEAVADAQPETPALPAPTEHDHEWRGALETRLTAIEEKVGGIEAALLEEDEPESEVLEPDVTVEELDQETGGGSGGFWSKLLKGK